MPEKLLNPDNRLLNWSINDLGLYGAALTPVTVSAAEQRQDDLARQDTRPTATDDASPPATVGDAGPGLAISSPTAPASIADEGLAAAPAAYQPMTLPMPMIGAPALSTLAVGAPADLSGGSTIGVFVPAPVPPPTASNLVSGDPVDTATTLAAPVLPPGSPTDGPTLTVPAIDGQLASALAASTAAIEATTATASQTIASFADTATDAVRDATQALDDTIQDATQTLADTAAAATVSLTDAVDGVTTSAVQSAEEAVGTAATAASAIVTPAVAPVIDALSATNVADTAAALVDATAATPVIDALAATDVVDTAETLTEATTAAPNDLLTGIGGTDPAGGVATLVDIVAAADEFDLSHVDAEPLADTGSIVDLLAVDLNDAPLLGVGEDGHDGGDDAPHGLFGL